MTRRLAEVARKVGVSEATVSRVLNGKPGVSRLHAPGGAHRARRPGLRAADQAARRAGPPRRPRAAGAPEPDLPGVRRGHGRRPRRSAGSRRSCAPRPRAASPRRTTSSCCSSSRCRGSCSPAASTPSRTRRTATTRASPSCSLPTVLVNASIEGLGFPRVSCDDAVAVEQALGHLHLARPHADRRARRAARPRAVEPQARRRPGASPKRAGIQLGPDAGRARLVLDRGRPGRRRPAARAPASPASCAPAT